MVRQLSEEEKQRARDIIAEEEAKKATAKPGTLSEDLVKRMESAHFIPKDEPSRGKK